MSRRFEILALLFLLLIILVPRLPALDSFVTVDESTWLMRSANFYYALGQRELENTVFAYHPAVTTMWIGATAMLLDFPEYRGLGQGYFEKEWQFSDFLSEQGYNPLQMLKTSRQITVGINVILLGMIYILIRQFLGWFPAFCGVLFLSFEPFLLGHTRILAHEGMMSLLLLVSLLALLIFLHLGHRWPYLILSAVAAALSVLTKSTATLVVPFSALLFLIDAIRGVRNEERSTLLYQGRRLAGVSIIWFVVFSMAFIAFWPGMWVNPGKMLTEVYGNAFSYALQGHNLAVTESETGSDTPINSNENGLQKYAQDMLWRTTPALWAGFALAIFVLFTNKSSWLSNLKRVILTFLGFGLLFYLMMSIARGRNAAHYIMATYASLSLVAGLGIAGAVLVARQKFSGKAQQIVPAVIFIGLLSTQAASAINFYPYYFNYSNPTPESIEEGIQTPVSGYGEGLELAAAYLAKKPGADQMTVLSWWGMGSFSYFFPGSTENIFPTSDWPPAMVERLSNSEYLVIYYYHQLRRNSPAKLLREIGNVNPEHTIWLNGVEYIRIYRVEALPDSAFIPDFQETSPGQ